MRTITDHKLNGLNEALEINVLDEPGQGGASHEYAITYAINGVLQQDIIKFQNGPIQEAGVNGISGEALLAIVIDRLRSFQAGPFACRENALAITKLEEALMWLQKRTRDRLARGVEGDFKNTPRRIMAFPPRLLKKARSLVKGIEVDLDAPLTGED